MTWAARLPGIEVPPLSLRLRDPVWGVDPSTKRAAITALHPAPDGADEPPSMRVASAEFDNLDGGARRMTAAAVAVRDLALALVEGHKPPRLVYVEQPFGGGHKGSRHVRPNPQQYFNVAAVQIGLGLALPYPTRIELIGPGEWKARAMGAGQGFAGKGSILAWARSVGYDRSCPKCHAAVDQCDQRNAVHDEADSVGIATAAGVTRFGEESRPT